MSMTFDDIVSTLTASDLKTMKGYIIDTVRAEFGPLITSLSEETYKDETVPEQPSRTYTLDLLLWGDSTIFSGGGITLLVDGETWEEAGRPSRIQIVASIA